MTAEDKIIFDNIETYVFSGAAGTGKSQRAQYVATLFNADYIIDDGLVIHKGSIVCGKSAKSESNKVSAIRRAIFDFDSHREAVIEYFKNAGSCSVMVIATSDGMANKILGRLGMKPPVRTVHIEDVATRDEMVRARKERYGKGQHVIPVSHALVRKNFAGKLVGQLKVFWGGREDNEAEKTIVRPPFSFYGEMHIEPEAIKQLVNFIALRTEQVAEIKEIRINPDDDGLTVEIDIAALSGSRNLLEVAHSVKKKTAVSTRYFTGLDIKKINVTVTEVLL